MLRLIDANLDRAAEGLRVLEDIARFLLNDQQLTTQAKNLRHGLLVSGLRFHKQLLCSRNAAEDIGLAISTVDELKREDISAIAIANSRRVQESLRVIEEFAKLPSAPIGLDFAKLERTRFLTYRLEQQLVLKLARHETVSRLTGLYFILDTQMLDGRDCTEVASQAIEGGATTIQLRDKDYSRASLLNLAKDLKRICVEKKALFIVNDHLDIALSVEADGLHLGQNDLPIPEARRLLPLDKIIGCSTATADEARQAEMDGVDYVALGSIYPTTSKDTFRLAGLERLQQVTQTVTVPVVAIGGINESNVEKVIQAGANAVAVISAISKDKDVAAAARRLTTKIANAIAMRDG